MVPKRLSWSNKDGFSVTTKSDGWSRIEQPVHWWARRGFVVFSHRFAQRDWNHSYRSANFPGTMGTDFLGLFPCRDCCLLPQLRCLFWGLASCLADRSCRRCRFPCLRCMWVILPRCYRGWLCYAWPLGSIPFSVWLFTCGPVHNGHSTGLRYLLRNVRLCCRGLPH